MTMRPYTPAFADWIETLKGVYETAGITMVCVELGYEDTDNDKIQPAFCVKFSDGRGLAFPICPPLNRVEVERKFLLECSEEAKRIIGEIDSIPLSEQPEEG